MHAGVRTTICLGSANALSEQQAGVLRGETAAGRMRAVACGQWGNGRRIQQTGAAHASGARGRGVAAASLLGKDDAERLWQCHLKTPPRLPALPLLLLLRPRQPLPLTPRLRSRLQARHSAIGGGGAGGWEQAAGARRLPAA